jgi:hypothetical protein
MAEPKAYNTNDPVLLAALNAPSLALEEKKKSAHGSPYRGVRKRRANGKWDASLGARGKNYNLGAYDTAEEAALSRNYAEELVPGAKKVRNVIPPNKFPGKQARDEVARKVVAILRRYGVLEQALQPKPQPQQPSPAAPVGNKVIEERVRENAAKATQPA